MGAFHGNGHEAESCCWSSCWLRRRRHRRRCHGGCTRGRRGHGRQPVLKDLQRLCVSLSPSLLNKPTNLAKIRRKTPILSGLQVSSERPRTPSKRCWMAVYGSFCF